MELNDRWEKRKITVVGTDLEVWIRPFENNMQCECFWQKEKPSVVSSGGSLIYHLHYPPLREVRTPGVPGVGYQYPHAPTPEIWYFPSCDFETVLRATRMFGFPDKVHTCEPEGVFDQVVEMLLSLNQTKHLAVSGIQSSHLIVELIDPGVCLSQKEAEAIMHFNKVKFGVNESAREQRDKMRHWINEGFITVGAI